ncbi:hypothetical protein C8J57DRAFT_1223436 [Mycena rebaudengoi]|nr:hypothetical protein C8J57DRAFT_1223436 [Mycena rebaudengoi]
MHVHGVGIVALTPDTWAAHMEGMSGGIMPLEAQSFTGEAASWLCIGEREACGCCVEGVVSRLECSSIFMLIVLALPDIPHEHIWFMSLGMTDRITISISPSHFTTPSKICTHAETWGFLKEALIQKNDELVVLSHSHYWAVDSGT